MRSDEQHDHASIEALAERAASVVAQVLAQLLALSDQWAGRGVHREA
jgi:hypothetical protein